MSVIVAAATSRAMPNTKGLFGERPPLLVACLKWPSRYLASGEQRSANPRMSFTWVAASAESYEMAQDLPALLVALPC
jgi:hypothetical protein